MKNQGGGTKRSSWLIFRRRLIVVRLLMRGSLTKDAIVAAVQDEMQGEGYVGDVANAFKNDLDALKQEYGCRIVFRRSSQVYALDDLGDLALLDLPDTCMEALAFLDASFPQGAAIPEHAHIRDLLDRVKLLLPHARRNQYRHTPVSLHLQSDTSNRIDAHVMQVVKHAAHLRQELIFDYRNNSDDTAITRHRVAPYEIFFRPDGHGYLDATLIEAVPRDPAMLIPAVRHYRLDRIIPATIAILPTKLPPHRVEPAAYTVRYWLHPNVARRRDVAAHLPHTEVTYQDDGSALVSATATNLWQARQILLRYGSACRVLEPPELVALFQQAVREMAQYYGG